MRIEMNRREWKPRKIEGEFRIETDTETETETENQKRNKSWKMNLLANGEADTNVI